MKKTIVLLALALSTAVGVGVWAHVKNLSGGDLVTIGKGMVRSRMERHTVEERVAEIVAKKPRLEAVAKSAGGSLTIRVFKNERRVEVAAPGWKTASRVYEMTAFSGRLGPKLCEGDGQIPEGIYGIEYLNPNSLYHLSLKVSYPNAEERARAEKEGRTNLGGDIMIHGRNVSVGCVAIGDEAIEEVFYLVHAVGRKNVKVIIAPYDMRKGRQSALEKSDLAWYPDLCRQLEGALR